MTIVQGTVLDSGKSPIPYARVTITLITSSPTQPGYSAAGELVGPHTFQADVGGAWSIDLTPNSLITPANTYYLVVEKLGASPIVVPASGGPYLVSAILATPPPTPGAPGITGVQVATGGTVAGTRPEINLVAGSGVSLAGADNPGAGRVDVTISSTGGAPAGTVQPGTAYGTASAVGTNTTYAREDHQHGTPSLTGAAPAVTEGVGQAAAVGTATTPARADHVHPMAAAGVPGASAVGDAAAAGAASTFAASDHRHAREAFGAAPATTLAIGTAAAAGTATTPAHSDHVHPMAASAAAGASAVGDTASAGAAATFAASDHRHSRESFAAPGNSAVGDAAAAGASSSVARADHVHGREAFGAVTALGAFNTAGANGSAATVSHSDHVHGAPALPGASTSVAGIVQLDGTATDIVALGTQAAGAIGKAADAGHVHPYQPHIFSVIAQGAKGDGKISNTGATTAASSTVTIGEAVLGAGDVGKVVMVKNSLNVNNAAGQTTSVGTITVVNSSTSFTATWNTVPTQTVTGLQVLWATDDTVAIQAAIAAANTYAQAHAGYAEVFFPTPPAGLYYGVGGALRSTDGTNAVYNSQLTIPVNAETNNAVTLVFRGTGGGQTRYWNSDSPCWSGGIQSFGVFTAAGGQTTSITGGGNPSVIGGPTGKNNYGVLVGANTTPTYTNTCVEFRDFTVLTTHSNSGWTYTAGNFFGCARFHAFNHTYGTNGTVQFYKYTPNLGDFTNVTLLSGGVSIGLLMPSNGNNASNYLQNVVCNGGYTYGLYATEHTVGNDVTILYSWSGICLVGSYSDSAGSGTVSALHAMFFDQACVEGCTFHVNIIGTGQSGIGPIVHMVLDTEGTVQLRDSEAAGANTGAGLAAAMGEIRLVGSPSTVTIQTGTGAGGLGTGLRIIKEQTLPGVPSSSIPTLVINTAVSNTLWRPATVYLLGGTGLTTIQVSRLAGGVNTVGVSTVADFTAAGTIAVPFPVRLGPGQWLKVNGTTIPTAIWVLD